MVTYYGHDGSNYSPYQMYITVIGLFIGLTFLLVALLCLFLMEAITPTRVELFKFIWL